MSNLKQQLVFGEALDRFQQVGIQAQFVLQLFLTLLHKKDQIKPQWMQYLSVTAAF